MSHKQNDIAIEALSEWFEENGHVAGTGVMTDAKGAVFIFKSGQKIYMPESLSELWKTL